VDHLPDDDVKRSSARLLSLGEQRTSSGANTEPIGLCVGIGIGIGKPSVLRIGDEASSFRLDRVE
jgi:hypothetical protein